MRYALLALITALLGLPGVALADEPGLILIYPSHGTTQHFSIRGRFIEDDAVRAPKKSSGSWRNAWRNAKLLESDEIEDAWIEVRVGGWSTRVKTDDDGVFEAVASLPAGKALAVGRHRVTARAIDDKGHPAPPADGALYVLPATGLAIISDIDDTILHSGVTSKRKLIANALLKNAAQVKPVAGAAAAYRRAREAGAQMVFYLSGSPQNFVRRIQTFLELNRFPLGPMLLKNFGKDPTFDQKTYKIGRLKQIFRRHPQMSFILVGDSGEQDPELYTTLRGMFPKRVAGILIRRVQGGKNVADRFINMTVIDDHAEAPEALLKMVQAAGPNAAATP